MDLAGGQYEETGTIVVNYIEVALRNVELRGVGDERSAPPTSVDTILATRLDEHTGDWRKSDGSSRHEEFLNCA